MRKTKYGRSFLRLGIMLVLAASITAFITSCSFSEYSGVLYIKGVIKNSNTHFGIFELAVEIDSLDSTSRLSPNPSGLFQKEIWYKSGGKTAFLGIKINEQKVNPENFTLIVEDSAGNFYRKFYSPKMTCKNDSCDLGEISISKMDRIKK